MGCSSVPRVAEPRQEMVRMNQVMSQIEIGQSLQEVEGVLNQFEVEYSLYVQEPKIRGIFRDVEASGAFVTTSVRCCFYFGGGNHLVRKETNDVLTGL